MSRSNEQFVRSIALRDAKIQELKEQVYKFSQEIDRLCTEHTPYPDPQALRPGNTPSQVRFWCEVCRTPWPCRQLNALRAAYGNVTGWEPATRPLPPLVMAMPKSTPTTDPEEPIA